MMIKLMKIDMKYDIVLYRYDENTDDFIMHKDWKDSLYDLKCAE